MPLLLTPAAPLVTTSHLLTASVYALIRRVSYDVDTKLISYEAAYYANEAARVARAAVLQIDCLPTGFTQPATPEEANAVPIFQFLEYALRGKLQELLGPDTTIDTVK